MESAKESRRRLVFITFPFLFSSLPFPSLLLFCCLLAARRETREEEERLITMARGRGGAGGGGGFGGSAAASAATDANAAAAKSSTATALNVPASALQLFYDLASVDEVRLSTVCRERLSLVISRSRGIGGGLDFETERGQEKGRGIRFVVRRSSGMRRLFSVSQLSISLSRAPPLLPSFPPLYWT